MRQKSLRDKKENKSNLLLIGSDFVAWPLIRLKSSKSYSVWFTIADWLGCSKFKDIRKSAVISIR